MIHLLIGADIVPTPSNEALFAKGDAESLLGKELAQRLAAADFISLNLETPLSEGKSPIVKYGPALNASPSAVQGLKKINPFFYTLANNHILDQDVRGLEATMDALKKNGIDFAGVGSTPQEAARPYIRTVKGVRFGFYCCVEHEFSVVTESKAGANPFDPLDSFDAVRDMKAACDFAVVLYHGGKELYQYPSPMLQRVFRKFADAGADLVIAQHTHCIGCQEKYKNSTLLYGQGNFLFDRNKGPLWETSLLVDIGFDEKSMRYQLELLPLRKQNEKTSLAAGDDAAKILKEFDQRSASILEPGFIQGQYARLAEQSRLGFYRRFFGRKGKNTVTRVLNRLTKNGYLRRNYDQSSAAEIENLMACEALRELALAALEQQRKKG